MKKVSTKKLFTINSKKKYKKSKKFSTKKSKKLFTRNSKKNILQHKVGENVIIIIKPYKENKKIKGIIKRILTKRKYHTRGHKVELVSGVIGRIIQ